jgi:hypothetical protein
MDGAVNAIDALQGTNHLLLERYSSVEEPYLIKHCVISNIINGYRNMAELPDVPFKADPAAYRSREFANILSGRAWWLQDILLFSDDSTRLIDRSIDLIDAELKE